jgi:hypothetical protein
MGEILNFQHAHSDEVAALYLNAMLGRSGARSRDLAKYLEKIFLEAPWRQEDIGALVYTEQGRILGFLGVMERRMQFEGQKIRVAVVSQFFIDREKHRGLGAVQLLRKFFSGPQDLSYTDGAAEQAARVWEAAGGEAARLYSFNWLRVLRPVATLQEQSIGRRQNGMWKWINGAVRVGAIPVDVLAGRWTIPQDVYASEQIDSDGLWELIQHCESREKLRPDYDRETFRWLMRETAEARYGNLKMKVCRDEDGQLAGWFIYYARRGGACLTMQTGARRQDQHRKILRSLFADASDEGGTSVKGQSQPKLLVSLTEEKCLFRHPNSSVLIQSRNEKLRAAIHRGDAALSRLDGECWLRFPAEDWR